MHTYQIQYQLNGETDWERIEATDPGNAFAKAQRMFPTAKIIKALRSGSYFNATSTGWTEYDPPAVQREIKPEPKAFNSKKAEANTKTFAFFDQLKK